MASWNFFNGNPFGKYISLYVDCQQISQDIANNSSTVQLIGTVNTNSGVQPVITGLTITVNINGGGAIEKLPIDLRRSEGKTVFSKNYTIPHNDDGSKQFDYSLIVSFDDGRYGSAQAGGTLRLPDIPRPDNILAHDCFFGDNIQLAISQNAQDFRHDIRYSYDHDDGYIIKDVTGNQNWTVPIDFLEHVTERPNAQITFYCDTFLNGNLVGTRTSTITASVPASAKPILHEFELVENNPKVIACGLDKDYFVQNFSQVTANAKTAEGYKDSTIKSFTCQIKNGVSFNDTRTLLDTAGSFEVQAYVTDSRGMQSDTVTKTIHVLEYYQPVLAIRARRSGETNTTATITRNISIAPLAINGKQHNTAKLSFRYTVSGSNVYLDDTGAGGSWTDIAELVNSDANMTADFDEAKNYIIEATLSDNFLTQVVTTNLLIANNYVYSYDKNKRFAVGKITDNSLPDGSIESTGGFYLNGKNILDMVKVPETPEPQPQEQIEKFTDIKEAVFIKKGDIVYVNVDFVSRGGSYALGTIPSNFRPQKDVCFHLPRWSTTFEGVPFFVNADGTVYGYFRQNWSYKAQLIYNLY